MAKHLQQFGWQYVVIDEGWYGANPRAKPADLTFVLLRPLLLDSSVVRWFRANVEDELKCQLFHRLQPGTGLHLPLTVC